MFCAIKAVLLSVAFLAMAFVAMAQSGTSCVKAAYNGTTNGFKEIFIGRCNYFLHVSQKQNCDINPAKYDCNAIWKEFETVVVGKDPCSLNVNHYTKFLTLVDHPIPKDRSLFWSGTYSTAHQYTKLYNYWTLEDTFSGFLLNELTYCSSPSGGFSYGSCQSACVTSNNSFWNAASKQFASKASGVASIFLNGTRRAGAVANTSTFYNYELPQLKVTKLIVFLLHTPGEPKVETCATGTTIGELKKNLQSRKIEFSCVDDPAIILHYICFENSSKRECASVNAILGGGTR